MNIPICDCCNKKLGTDICHGLFLCQFCAERFSGLETEVEMLTMYKKEHPLHGTYRIIMTKEPYNKFEPGDKSYTSITYTGWVYVQQADKFNDNRHHLVIASILEKNTP